MKMIVSLEFFFRFSLESFFQTIIFFSYLSTSWSLPSYGSHLGIRDPDIKAGTGNGKLF